MTSHNKTVRTWALPAAVLSRAREVGAAIEDLAQGLGGQRARIDTGEIIAGRAALLGLDRPGRISSGGASRLLTTADGWCALTLSRAEDLEGVPALVELAEVDDPWAAVASAARTQSAAEFVARARLLDLPATTLGEVAAGEPVVTQHNSPSARSIADLLVVDMSSMWAGPLCGRLLAAAGATVVKVETPNRPDGTRSGDRRFFDWMNSEKLSFSTSFDSHDITALLRVADVVIEGSRPAALARRGLSADAVEARPGRVWLRISGYGSGHPERVAFGDDAAVAGGLVDMDQNGPAFCGDAIADPLTGLTATAAALDALSRGGGVIIDISMAAIAAIYAGLPHGGRADYELHTPALPAQPAHDLGADNPHVRTLIEERLVAC